MPKQEFKRGDILILVHDPHVESFAVGDRFTFEGYCESCGFIKVKEINYHIQPSLVEKFKDGSEAPEAINETFRLAVLTAMRRLALLPGLTLRAGQLPADAFVGEFYVALDIMGIKSEFYQFCSGQHPLQHQQQHPQQPVETIIQHPNNGSNS